jgi:septal ring factor EnvC (AmiA/AmiB activator)
LEEIARLREEVAEIRAELARLTSVLCENGNELADLRRRLEQLL